MPLARLVLVLLLGGVVAAPCGDGASGPSTGSDDGRRTLGHLIPNLGRR